MHYHLGIAITVAKGHEPELYEALCVIAGPFLKIYNCKNAKDPINKLTIKIYLIPYASLTFVYSHFTPTSHQVVILFLSNTEHLGVVPVLSSLGVQFARLMKQ